MDIPTLVSFLLCARNRLIENVCGKIPCYVAKCTYAAKTLGLSDECVAVLQKLESRKSGSLFRRNKFVKNNSFDINCGILFLGYTGRPKSCHQSSYF
jgi:hypothetical protein